ncbi:MAG: Gfo/Idh/MocA family oxidoreductase [Acetobacteraceae bacterium]|nr:Gfo/Idh/MocA family oxidoreductase [Acetobacteraceae bacterium]
MIGIAVIGLGAALAPHAKALIDLNDRVRVVHAVARNPETRRAAAEQFGFPATGDAAAAIADPRVDAVMILTPTNAHLELAEAAFAAGKHVLCEKPLDVTVERAERLVIAGRRSDRRLSVMLQLRFRAASQRLKSLLDVGALGEIQAATMTVPWWRAQSYYDQPGRGVKARDGGGVMMIQAIHTLDLFRWFVGVGSVEASIVRTTALHRMETEDYASALVRLGNGAPGTIVATVAAYPGGPEQIMVIGSKGIARMDGSNLRVSYLDGTEEVLRDDVGTGTGTGWMAFSHEPHKAVIGDFLDAIEQDRDPAIPGEDALATQRVIDDIVNKGQR